MRIGHDETIGRDDEARAHATRHFFLLALATLLAIAARGTRLLLARDGNTEEAAEEFLHFRIIHAATLPLGILAHALGSTNIHHRRTGALDDVSEVRQGRHRGRSHGRRGLHGRCCSKDGSGQQSASKGVLHGSHCNGLFYLDFSSMELAT